MIATETENINITITPSDRELWEFLLKRRYGYGKGGIKSGVVLAVREIVKDEVLKLAREQTVKDR